MDALARAGARFPAAVAPVPLTLPSHASLLTGVNPPRLALRDNGQTLGDGVATLAELLARAGWVTGAVVSGYPLRAEFGLDRGFGSYDDRLPLGAGGRWGKRPAPDTASAALAWVAAVERAEPRRPWFLWVHFFDPHDPYQPPARLRLPGDRGAYDGEVRFVDEALERLESVLGTASRGTNLLTVLAADHGESLGEHGEATHGFFIYDATVLVPLAIRWPGRIRPGEIAAPARLVDLAPTLLTLLGLETPQGLDGRSLGPLLEGGQVAWEPAYFESLEPWLGYGWAPLTGLRRGRWKLIVAPRPELYDIEADPGELRNRYSDERRAAEALRRELETVAAGPPLVSGAPSGAPDAEMARQLRALGYLGGAVSGGQPAAGAADPKDRLALREALLDAEARRDGGDLPGALGIYRRVLAEEPENRLALLRSGQVLTALGRPGEAAAPLARLVAVAPAQAEARYALADAYSKSRNLRAAAAAWADVVRLQPRRAVAWSNLGIMRLALGDVDGALGALRRAAELAPGDADLSANLAQALLASSRRHERNGDRTAAATALAEALRRDPALRPEILTDPKLGGLAPR